MPSWKRRGSFCDRHPGDPRQLTRFGGASALLARRFSPVGARLFEKKIEAATKAVGKAAEPFGIRRTCTTKGHGSQWWPHARLTEPRAQGGVLGERSHASLATHGVQAGGPRWKVAVMIWPYYFEQAPSADAPETVPRRGSNR